MNVTTIPAFLVGDVAVDWFIYTILSVYVIFEGVAWFMLKQGAC